MTKQRRLEITGYQDRPVPNRFIRQDGAADRLAILLPGFGYTLDMPLFYYAQALLTEAGADLLRVEYAYNTVPGFGKLSPEEADRWLATDVRAAYQAAITQRHYRELILVGKSLGTMAMAHLLTGPERFAGDIRAIWLTPAFRRAGLAGLMAQSAVPSLIILGDADPHYDPAALAALPATMQSGIVMIPGANHGLDRPGDVNASVAALAQAVSAMAGFMRGNQPGRE